MSSKSTTKTKNTQTLNPWALQQYESTAAPLKEFAFGDVDAYEGDLTVGLDGMQTQAADMAAANIGAGQGAVSGALNAAQQAGGYTPMNVSAGQIADADLSAYMNPYQDEVADKYLAGLDRSRQMAITGQSGEMTKAGAWGGSRHGVADSLTNEAFAREASSGLSSILQGGYDRATGLAGQDIGFNLNASLANQGAGLQGNAQQLQAAGLQGQLGAQQQQMGQSDAAFLNNFGIQQQQNAQGALDAQYQEYLRQQDQQNKQMGLGLGVLGATPYPMNSTGKSTTSQSNPMSAIGTAIQAAAMFASDERLKQDVEAAGVDARGREWFSYAYTPEAHALGLAHGEPGQRHRGVMAQRIIHTDPDAVHRHPTGFLMVDYSELH